MKFEDFNPNPITESRQDDLILDIEQWHKEAKSLDQIKQLVAQTYGAMPDDEYITQALLVADRRKDQPLQEVRMGPSDLDRFVNSPEAAGIVAGFEAELCYTGIGGGQGEPDYDSESEPDYDYDERADDIDDICRFFGRDYNSSYEIRDLRERLEEDYNDWRYEQLNEDWEKEMEDRVRDYIEENDWDFDEVVEDYLRDELGLDEEQIEAAMLVGKSGDTSKISSSDEPSLFDEDNEAVAHYAEASDHADSVFEEKVEESINDRDYNYDRAREEWEEEVNDSDDYSEREWLSSAGYNQMTDIESYYSINWPYYEYPSSNGNKYDYSNAKTLAASLAQTLSVRTVASRNYHTTDREPGLWIIEPDPSIKPDMGDMPAETVSPPMSLKECLASMQNYFDWAKNQEGAYSNESTGLHIGVSLPFVDGRIDYLKAAVLLGDMYVLKKFDREANTYTTSAMEKIQLQLQMAPERVGSAMKLLRSGLIELANKALGTATGFGKYTSINWKGKYVEFRSMGDDYLSHIDDVMNTVKRYAYVMYLASRPDLEREEYAKKLYKLLAAAGVGKEDIISTFVNYSTGRIDQAQLIRQLRSRKHDRAIAAGGGNKYWWNVQWDSSRRMEVVARNKAEARAVAAKEWGVPVEQLAIAKITVIKPFDPNTPEGDAHRRHQERTGAATATGGSSTWPFDTVTRLPDILK